MESENKTSPQPSNVESTEKNLLREDELTDLSKMPNLPTDEKTRLEKLKEKGQELFDKAKDTLSNLSSKLPGSAKEVKEQVSEKASDITSTRTEPTQPSSKDNEDALLRKLAGVDEDYVPPSTGPSTTTEEGPYTDVLNKLADQVSTAGVRVKEGSIVEGIQQGIQNLSAKISQTVGHVIPHKKGEPDQNEQVKESRSQEPESTQAPGGGQSFGDKIKEKVNDLRKTVNEAENKAMSFVEKVVHKQEGNAGFREVTTGFSETESELKKEREEPLGLKQSNNPFEVLADENIALAQPLSNADIVGGNVEAIPPTTGHEITEPTENKTLLDKAKEAVSNVSTKIGGAIQDTKEKIKPSAAAPLDKENAPQTA